MELRLHFFVDIFERTAAIILKFVIDGDGADIFLRPHVRNCDAGVYSLWSVRSILDSAPKSGSADNAAGFRPFCKPLKIIPE